MFQPPVRNNGSLHFYNSLPAPLHIILRPNSFCKPFFEISENFCKFVHFILQMWQIAMNELVFPPDFLSPLRAVCTTPSPFARQGQPRSPPSPRKKRARPSGRAPLGNVLYYLMTLLSTSSFSMAAKASRGMAPRSSPPRVRTETVPFSTSRSPMTSM